MQYDGPLWKRVALFASGIAVSELQKVGRIGLETLSRKTNLDAAQIQALANRAVQLFGSIDEWDREDWRALGQNARGISGGLLAEVSVIGLQALAEHTNLDVGQVNTHFESMVAYFL